MFNKIEKVSKIRRFVVDSTYYIQLKNLETVHKYNKALLDSGRCDKLLDYDLIPLTDYYAKLPSFQKMLYSFKNPDLKDFFNENELNILKNPDKLIETDLILEMIHKKAFIK